MQNTLDEWNIIFTISAVFYILPAFIFIAFGSTEVQEWNDSDAKKKYAINDEIGGETGKFQTASVWRGANLYSHSNQIRFILMKKMLKAHT